MTPTSTSNPSATAIQSAILIRLRRSFIAIALKLPRRPGDPRLSDRLEPRGGVLRSLPVGEQAVEHGPGAAHVRAERAELLEPERERRRGEVIRGQRGEVA